MAQIFYITEQLRLTQVTLAYNAAIFYKHFYIGNRVLNTIILFTNRLLAENCSYLLQYDTIFLINDAGPINIKTLLS